MEVADANVVPVCAVKRIAQQPAGTNAHRRNNQVKLLVIDRSKTPHFSFRLSILLATLGMCVFLWGLAYKLSLYETHEPTIHQIPEAKFLSRNEDPSATDALRHCLSSLSKPAGSVLLISVIAFWRGVEAPSSKVVHRGLELKQPPSSCLNGTLIRFFFRPPPDLIRL